jgi:hypothetical protein
MNKSMAEHIDRKQVPGNIDSTDKQKVMNLHLILKSHDAPHHGDPFADIRRI